MRRRYDNSSFCYLLDAARFIPRQVGRFVANMSLKNGAKMAPLGRVDRRGARRGRSFARPDVIRSAAGVFVRRG